MQYKTLFCLAAFLALSAVVSAQKIALGFRAGYTRSNVATNAVVDSAGSHTYDLDDQWKPLGGWHAGLDLSIPLFRRLNLLAGFQYAHKGYEYGLLYWPSGPARTSLHFHYLDFSLLANYRVWSGLSLQAGLEPGILLKAVAKSGGESFDPDNGFGLVGGPYEKLNLNLLAGLEWQFDCGVFVDGRGSWGVLPLSSFGITDDIGIDQDKINAYNRAWQFSVGYRYPLGSKERN